MKSEIHYIIGLGRSGSTLLTTMLNSHSSVKGIPEIPMIIFFLYLFNKKKKIDPEFIQHVKTYLGEYQTIRPKEIVDLQIEKLPNITTTNDYYSFCKEVYESFNVNGTTGIKEIYIDKNPPYTLHYNRLTSLSKNSRFIILVRDYRANVLSRKQKQYTKSGNIAFNAFRWKLFHKELIKYKNNPNCLLIRYEDLVMFQEKETRRVCDFLSLKFDSSILNYQKIDFDRVDIDKGKTRSFAKTHFKGLKKGINTSRVHAWKEQLTPKEIKTTEQICGSVGLNFDYKQENAQSRFSLVSLIHFRLYIKALISYYKEKVTYYLPIKFKLKRLKKSMHKLR